jgi:DNA repair exonuclease SbcCD ATPase subunit
VEPEPAVIRSVSIQNFRGFKAERTIDLAASAIIVSGPNGKGKTSFFDALQWLLLGSLSRLADLASRRSGDYIVNKFAGSSATATVRAQLRLNERDVTVIRTGDHKTTSLQWIVGETTLTNGEAEQALCEALLGDREMSLKDMVLNSGILQQDVVRAVLEDEPKNRYRHMAALLGLEEISGFEDQAKRQAEDLDKRAKSARDEHQSSDLQLRTAQTELTRLEQRLATQPEITQARLGLEGELAEKASSLDIRALPTRATDAVALGQLARRIRTRAEDLLSEDAELREQEPAPSVTDQQLATVRASIESAAGECTEAQTALKQVLEKRNAAEQRARHLSDLATFALPVLGDRCPVCEQTIDRQNVEAHLRELVGAGGADLSELMRATADAQQRVAGLEENLVHLRAQGDELRLAIERGDRIRAARRKWQQACEDLGSTSEIQISVDARQALAVHEIDALVQLRVSADELAGAAERLASLLGTTGLAEELERRREQVETLGTVASELSDNAARVSRQAEEAKTMAGAATRAIAGVTRDRFASLQPLVDDIFARLAPHPAFTALGFEMGSRIAAVSQIHSSRTQKAA